MKFPKVKAMLMPYVNEENNGIRLGGFQYGIARDIICEDPQMMLDFLKDLNGQNGIEFFAEKYHLSIIEVIELLECLALSGAIYENNKEEYGFTNNEAQYYTRNINLFSWIDTKGLYYNYWEVQHKLKESKVLLLGAGGTGGNCGISLARIGVGEITIVDYDKIEISNLNRQVYTYQDVGKDKAQTLVNHINNVNPFIKCKSINSKIQNVNNLLNFGLDFDLVICCIDQPDNINKIVEEYTNVTGIPRILGGYASTVVTSGIFTKDSYSYQELYNTLSNQNYDAENVNRNTHMWEWENAIVSPIAYISGNISALSALYFLTDIIDLVEGQINHIDLYNFQNKHFSYAINEKGVMKGETYD